MSDGGHHHGGDTGGQPGTFPPPEHHHQHSAEPSDQNADPWGPIPPAYGPRPGVRRYRPRAGSPAWAGLWVVRLAILAFIVFAIFEIVHGASSTPAP